MSYPFFFMAIRFLAWLSVKTWSNLSQSWFNLAAGGITLLLTDFPPIPFLFLSFSFQFVPSLAKVSNFFKLLEISLNFQGYPELSPDNQIAT